jgi:hypothetical protein
VTVDAILQRTHGIVQSVMQPTGSKSEWQALKKRVADFLNDAVKTELSPWLARIPQQPMWNFRNALASDQTTRTGELKSLQRSTHA